MVDEYVASKVHRELKEMVSRGGRIYNYYYSRYNKVYGTLYLSHVPILLKTDDQP